MYSLATLVLLAGCAQLVLVAVSPVIPILLKWKEGLSPVTPLIRQIFWTYAVYILVINFFFGLISVLSPSSLCNGTFLAASVTGFICLYWLGRIAVQFFYFDRKSVPAHWIYQWGEVCLIALFVFLSAVYALAFYSNLSQLFK